MKISLNADFTKFPRATSVTHGGGTSAEIAGKVALAHDERSLRSRVVEMTDGGKVRVDLPQTVSLADGNRLILEDGRQIEVVAAAEPLFEIRGRDAAHLAELAWHCGSLHIPSAIYTGRMLILRDKSAGKALEDLGATVIEVMEPFRPLKTVHSMHTHGHHHHDDDQHRRDAYGRHPGDPHFGHNHP